MDSIDSDDHRSSGTVDLTQADIAIAQANITVGHADVSGTQTNTLIGTDPVHTTYRDRCAGLQWGADLLILDAIRTAHPGSTITPISIRSCDLVGFAKAGHAAIQLQIQGDKFNHERTYTSLASRLEGGQGTLGDKVSYGKYRIHYEGQFFDFYVAQWIEKYKVPPKVCFILSPKQPSTHLPSPAVDNLLLAAGKWTSELHDEIYVFDDGNWEKNKKLWSAVQSSTWEDVILDPTMKDTLISDVENFFDSRSLYEEYAVPWKRGIIFHGTPGCGKTISIRALMNTLDKRDPPVVGLYVKTFQSCNGLHYSIRRIFNKAREMAPCLLIFEDLDSLVVDKVRSYFLNEVDGLEDNNGILMIGSTNHLDRLDPGISKRPSRFDRKYHFKIPGERERVLYAEYWKRKLEKNSNVDFDPEICSVVAKLTDGFSFAYMKELFVQTLLTIVGGRADVEEEEDGTTQQSEDSSEPEIVEIADATKVIEGSGKVAIGDEKIESTEGKEGDAAEKEKEQHKMPMVEIPEHLQSNALLRVLRKQAFALWKDMDNTRDEEAGVKKGIKSDEYDRQLRRLRAINAERLGEDYSEDEDSDDD